jgi:nitrogen fixation protein FixH
MSKTTDNRWAIGLIVAFGVFGAGLCVMVVASVTKNVDLVTDNYYEKGLRHEQQIQTVKRTQTLAEQVSMATGNNVVALSFPDRFPPAMVKGEVLLYRPSDRRLDVAVPVRLDSVGQQRIPTGGLERGLWKVQLSWTYRGVNYYSEQPMILR